MTIEEPSNEYIRKRKNMTSSRDSIVGTEQHGPVDLSAMIGRFCNSAVQ